jgi:hypothetical protein
MHRLRRAREDSKQFHALPWSLNSPRLPGSGRLPAQTTQLAPQLPNPHQKPAITMKNARESAKTCVSSCAFLGKLRRTYARTSFGRANHVEGYQ